MSHLLRPHGLQHATLPCPSPTPTLMFIKSVIPSNHFILCHPLLLLPSIFPSIKVFPRSPSHQVVKIYWSFSFRISSSNEYSELISLRTDWFYLLEVQGTLKSLLQHHSSKALILLCSVFFIVQLSISICDHWKNHSFDPLLQIFKID